jgi:hypothetical protein
MTGQARPNLGGLFDGSTPPDRTSSVAGRLGPRLVTAPVGRPAEPAVSTPFPAEPAEAGIETSVVDPAAASRASESARPSIDPLAWFDPIRALEVYFGVLQAVLDANRHCVMGLAGVLVTGGSRLRGGLGSTRTKP